MDANSTLTTFAPAEAAAELHVNAHTVRRWCAAHADHLSAGANPGPDAPRRLSTLDMQVLREVQALRAQGLHVEAINARLADLTFAEVDTEQNNAATPPENGVEALQLPTVVVEALVARLDAAERAQRDRAWAFALGYAGGIGSMAVLVLIMLGLAALVGR